MNPTLHGKVALIAGASRGIGRAIAETLASHGASIVAIGRDEDRLGQLRETIVAAGGACETLAFDLADDAALRSALDGLSARGVAAAVFVHAAATIYRHQRLHTLEISEIDRLHRVDVRSATLLAAWALPSMMTAGFGRIVFLGSLAAQRAIPGATLYGSGKAALEGLARGIALDYARYGVTANVLSLGFVETERLRERLGEDPVARAKLVDATATKRIISPEEVADATLFLCSDSARSITGTVLDITGGAHLCPRT